MAFTGEFWSLRGVFPVGIKERLVKKLNLCHDGKGCCSRLHQQSAALIKKYQKCTTVELHTTSLPRFLPPLPTTTGEG